MWLKNLLLKQNQDIFEYFIPRQHSKLDNFLNHGADNKTDLPVTRLDISDGSDLNSNYITQFSNNESDVPNDTIYMVCGVVIAMLLVGLIIILVAVTINKLRKRDESSPASAVTIESQQQQHGLQIRSHSSDNNYYNESQDQQMFTTSSMTDSNGNNTSNNSVELESITFTRTSGGCTTSNGWVFPPKAPSPNIYNDINHDALNTANERNGFKGFRKQFSGRFKRLVSKKTDATSPIPPELKPQLKTIYVY